MSHYKALFLDIDGTIIRPDDTIEHSTKQAILEVLDRGMEVILTTGRPIHEIRELAAELQVQSFIGYNGAAAIIQGKRCFEKPLPPTHVEQVLTIAGAHQHELALHTGTANYLTSLDSPAARRFVTKFAYRKNEPLAQRRGSTDDVLAMTFINMKPDDVHFYESVPSLILSQANVDGMQQCFDVLRDNVNKGTGVSLVLEHMGIVKEEAIAFGDGLNDKEMLQSVGESFAMGNAHPDLFAIAKNKTTDVMESGIYHGLRTLGLVE
ncbi:Cof-type HAD-IIB family hydrolase [Neobacillus jeddahensis]|uniref:Cof-type HAD-IIB family hydrolase n=1 Tax=Neobacillus jeddahensis TaxID=1461580 RepID=UPI00058B74CF|nr:Cof-type HAD-IIB family hydrolase [Neobacillus jeddahensis]